METHLMDLWLPTLRVAPEVVPSVGFETCKIVGTTFTILRINLEGRGRAGGQPLGRRWRVHARREDVLRRGRARALGDAQVQPGVPGVVRQLGHVLVFRLAGVLEVVMFRISENWNRVSCESLNLAYLLLEMSQFGDSIVRIMVIRNLSHQQITSEIS